MPDYLSEIELIPYLNNNDIQPYLQPYIALDTGNIVGAEVLLRITTKERTIEPPEIFNSITTQYLLGFIDLLVLEKTFLYLDVLLEKKIVVNLSVNIGAFTVENIYALSTYLMLLNRAPKKAQISVELSEHIIDNFTRLIEAIKVTGINLQLDDFGTGSSNIDKILLYNKDFKVVKLDKIFVNKLDTQLGRDRLHLITLLINSVNCNTLLEGIETAEHLLIAKENKITYGQGFYIYKPMPFNEFLKLVS